NIRRYAFEQYLQTMPSDEQRVLQIAVADLSKSRTITPEPGNWRQARQAQLRLMAVWFHFNFWVFPAIRVKHRLPRMMERLREEGSDEVLYQLQVVQRSLRFFDARVRG